MWAMTTHDFLTPIREAANAVGGVSELARRIGVHHSAVCHWRKVPAERVLAVEAATESAVTRYDMRPDLYPRPGKGARQ